jgi:type I restriction enzyme R subunit
MGESDVLEPFTETVERRFKEWLTQQETQRKKFTPEQREWLNMIKDHVAASLSIEMNDFENVPFNQKGGAIKAYKLFGSELNVILKELNKVLVN